jgi:hypothetical protein
MNIWRTVGSLLIDKTNKENTMKKILFIIMATLASQMLFSKDITNTYIVNDDHVNVRSDPGLDTIVRYQLNKGDEVLVLDRTYGKQSIGDQNDYWYLIADKDLRVGCVYGSLITPKLEMNLMNNVPFTLLGPDFDPKAAGKLMYQINGEVIKDRNLETHDYNNDNLFDLLNQNIAYSSLYQEIYYEILSNIQNYEEENHLQLELDSRDEIKIIEMENKTFLLYDIKYAELIDLDDTNFAAIISSEGWVKEESEWPRYQYVIGTTAEGAYIIYPDGNYRSLSHSISKIHPYTLDRNFEETLFTPFWDTKVNRVTDLDGDDNPELWCSSTGYESSSSSMQFLTEDSIYESGVLFGSHDDGGPSNSFPDGYTYENWVQ